VKINHLITYNTKVLSLSHSALKIVLLSKEVCIVYNPFTCSHSDLISVSSGVVATPSCENDMMNAWTAGEEATAKFHLERIATGQSDLHAPITKMKLQSFTGQARARVKDQKGSDIKISDRQLFTRLLILGKAKNVDLKLVLSHSLSPVSYPLASTDGSLAKTNKAALLRCLETKWPDCLNDVIPANGALIVDGMALIHGLSVASLPGTLGQLATMLLTKVCRLCDFGKYSRIDVIFDRYPEFSIKSTEHIRRGSNQSSIFQHIYRPEQRLPVRWKNYLLSGRNKEQLVEFLYSQWSTQGLADSCFDLYIDHGDSWS